MLLADLGFDHIFLTPHFRQGFFENSASSVREASEQLRVALGNRLPAVRFTEAHEVHLGSVFDSHGRVNGIPQARAEATCTCCSSCRASRFRSNSCPGQSTGFLSKASAWYSPILRSTRSSPRTLLDIESLCERGVKLQLNITSLAGFAGRQARRAAESLCSEGMVHAMGTDTHSLAHAVEFVPKGMRRALKLLGEKRLRATCRGCRAESGQPWGDTHVELKEYVYLIWRRKALIIVAFLAVVVTVGVYVFLATPLYEADCKLLLVEDKSKVSWEAPRNRPDAPDPRASPTPSAHK